MGKLALMTHERWIAPLSFVFLLIAYHLIFGPYFPTRGGMLGHDYSRVLPDLLDGYLWFKGNGLLEPFWFTPTFCGGQPALGDPQSGFYSIAQFLTFYFDPVSSVYATVLLFASIGFWGFYLLLRSGFSVSRQAAILGGALFMFNGFFIHRMMIGHFPFHGVMLIPVIAWLLLRPNTEKSLRYTLLNGIATGCILAYAAYSGLITLLLPCAAAVLAIICVHGLSGRVTPDFLPRALIAAVAALGLSAAKLAATLAFLGNFSRSDYSLPGAPSLWGELQLLFNILFISPANIADRALHWFAEMQWALERQEWEYGITLIPLLIIVAGVSLTLKRNHKSLPSMNVKKWLWLMLLGCILILPLALNFFTADWNAFLKQLPAIKSSSNLLRWFLIYIPVVILAAALTFDRISLLASHRYAVLLVALAALIALNGFKDRGFYQTQNYRADTIVNAWQAASTNDKPAHIEYIGAVVDANQRIIQSDTNNDLIATGTSALVCYNPMFGYQMEKFPVKSLHPGPIMDEAGGRLNIKNPACYLYPQENSCTPGDHFTLDQRKAARDFANYQPFQFKVSTTQQLANWITKGTLTLLVLLFVVAIADKIMRAIKVKQA